MYCTIIGIAHNVGEYQGKPFDSIRVYVTGLSARGLIAGDATGSYKCKASEISRVFGTDYNTAEDLTALIGEKVMICLDRYDNITGCMVAR